MEENKVLIGALIFFGLILGANFIMYAIVRGATRPGGRGLLNALAQALTGKQSRKKDDMAELRRSVQALTQGGDSEEKSPE